MPISPNIVLRMIHVKKHINRMSNMQQPIVSCSPVHSHYSRRVFKFYKSSNLKVPHEFFISTKTNKQKHGDMKLMFLLVIHK